jgi:alkaline phosphatase
MSAEDSIREDERNLIQEMAAAGYTVVQTADELAAVDFTTTDHLLGLFADASMAYAIDRADDQDNTEPTLADMTSAALQVLSRDEDGFFLMVEDGRIDHAANYNDPRGTIDEVLAFDDAVRVALDYQAANPDVLVIVTADHETGGLSLGRTSGYRVDLPSLTPITCSLERLNYKFRNTDALKAVNSCGLRLEESDIERLLEHPADTDLETLDNVEADSARTWGHLVVRDAVNREARLSWGTTGHTAAPVLVYVSGPDGDLFEGGLDNTDIAKNIAALLGLSLDAPAGTTSP